MYFTGVRGGWHAIYRDISVFRAYFCERNPLDGYHVKLERLSSSLRKVNLGIRGISIQLLLQRYQLLSFTECVSSAISNVKRYRITNVAIFYHLLKIHNLFLFTKPFPLKKLCIKVVTHFCD